MISFMLHKIRKMKYNGKSDIIFVHGSLRWIFVTLYPLFYGGEEEGRTASTENMIKDSPMWEKMDFWYA